MKKLKRIESDSEATELYVVYYSPESGKCIAPTPKKKKVRDTIKYTTSDNSMITSYWLDNNTDKIISHTYEDGVGTIVLDVDNVTDMGYMFEWCSSLTLIDLSSLDTHNVTNMSGMFEYCSSLTSINLQGIDTSNVTDMYEMFYGCDSLTSIDLSRLKTSNVTNMSNMFYYCESLTSIDLSPLDTHNVTNMNGMFIGCKSLTSIDLSPLDTHNVTNMRYMFRFCKSLTSVRYNNVEYTVQSDLIAAIGEKVDTFGMLTGTSLR